MSNKAYASINGVTGILSVSVEEGFSQISATATIECKSTSLNMADAITIDMGYDDNHAQIFTGFVKKIEYVRPNAIVKITAYDTMVRASDFFLASDDPANPLSYDNISAHDLVADLLSQAGITMSASGNPPFTFGTSSPAEFNLQSVADAVNFVCQVVGYTIHSDSSGIAQLKGRKPYVVGGDVSVGSLTTGNSGNIIDIDYLVSNDKLRNKVVVYGLGDIHSTASATSPYVVVDQTCVIAHPLIDTQSMADATASVNLTLLNRLSETYTLTVRGDPNIRCRDIRDITESYTHAVAKKVFIYRANHILNEGGGYTTSITANP